MNFGVLIDQQGFPIGAFRWPDNEPTPNFNGPGTAPNQRLIMLTSDAAVSGYRDPIQRWDFADEVWLMPTERYWLVDQNGKIIGGKGYWPERPPIANPGQEIVLTPPPPKVRGRSGYFWDSPNQTWKLARVVAVLDGRNVVRNIALENPRDDRPNVPLPPGLARGATDDEHSFENAEGSPISKDCLIDSGGAYRRVANKTKGNIAAWVGQNGHGQAWGLYVADNARYQNAADDAAFDPLAEGFVLDFLEQELGFDRDAAIDLLQNQI